MTAARPQNPIDGFTATAGDLTFVGDDLRGPACLLTEPDGSLWASTARGGVVQIRPDGRQSSITPSLDMRFGASEAEASVFAATSRLQGLAFDVDGSLIVANAGTGRLERMARDGRATPMLDRIDGAPLGAVQSVVCDRRGRVWLGICPPGDDPLRPLRPGEAQGHIAVLDNEGARIVADGLAGIADLRFDATGDWLHVAETSARRISRLQIGPGARVITRDVFGPTDCGGFVGGIAFDAHGNLWATHAMADRLIALTPQGDLRVILADGAPGPAAALLEAFVRDAVTPNHLTACHGTLAPGFAGLAFGGPDRRTLFIGSRGGHRIPALRSPVAGLTPTHWP